MFCSSWECLPRRLACSTSGGSEPTAGRSGTTGTGSRVPRPGSRCSTRSEGTQSLWKHNQFLAREGEKRNTCRGDSRFLLGRLVNSWSCCYSHCVADLYPALPLLCWKQLNLITHKHRPATTLTSTGTQGWVSGCGLLTLEGRSAGCLPNLTLTQRFQVLLKRNQGTMLCLFESYTISYLQYLLGQHHSHHTVPQASFLGGSSAGQPLHHSYLWLARLILCAKKQKTVLEWVKKENSSAINVKAAASAPISLVQRKHDICSCYG